MWTRRLKNIKCLAILDTLVACHLDLLGIHSMFWPQLCMSSSTRYQRKLMSTFVFMICQEPGRQRVSAVCWLSIMRTTIFTTYYTHNIKLQQSQDVGMFFTHQGASRFSTVQGQFSYELVNGDLISRSLTLPCQQTYRINSVESLCKQSSLPLLSTVSFPVSNGRELLMLQGRTASVYVGNSECLDVESPWYSYRLPQ